MRRKVQPNFEENSIGGGRITGVIIAAEASERKYAPGFPHHFVEDTALHRTLFPIKNAPVALTLTAVSLAAATLAFGCRKSEPEAPPAPKAPVTISDADLTKHKPNEAGAIMVLMYHRIAGDEKSNDLNRPPAEFRKDLETLHAKGYYPVNAWDIVANKMDVPAGKTPVAITFDDALPTQFKLIQNSKGETKIDPNCAVGIMETFSKAHPDWPTRATFFVLPKKGKNSDPFGQSESVALKFEYLVSKGYEIANHTATHTSMRGM
ncbi:MAG TPA: hypothetical protein VF719_06625, partial [Abditibacteriaceae bacterium]